ncbi:AsnC family protein [Nonomuraea sp. NPDC055795]
MNVLARDGRTGPADLAVATGWSQSTVRRRQPRTTQAGTG